MLVDLKVTNFAVIDNIQIEFASGFNILSGETGAGKSILMKSLGLLMGAKSSPDMIRSDADTAIVEGSFDVSKREDIQEKLKEFGIESEDGLLIVRRLISAGGKSRVYINGSLAPLQNLQELVAPLIEFTSNSVPLIEMTGQHENKNLMSKAYHLVTLDRFGGSYQKRREYSEKFSRLAVIRNQIFETENSERVRSQRLDFLCYQRDEIKCFQLRDNEETEIEIEYGKLKNSSQIQSWAQQCEASLYSDDDSALVRIHKVLQKSQEIQVFDPSMAATLEPLKQAKTLLDDFVFSARTYLDDLDADPERLDNLEKRRSDLKGLVKKYGPTVAEVFSNLEKMESEILSLSNSEETLKRLRVEEKNLQSELETLAKDLHKKRIQAAKLLAGQVNKELLSLNMKGMTFEITVEKLEELNLSGHSEVEYLISSPKDKARPIGKTASGGELSRILLSLKSVIGQSDFPRTCLFDEVDAGVSGPTAEMVGKKLKAIAKGQQVICVTHLPQVAAHGDNHYLIQKKSASKGFQTEVLSLKKEDRVREIARLISGEKITQTSLAHAKQLLTH
jgi:DNA repair protein RecN (Recombination protein N)